MKKYLIITLCFLFSVFILFADSSQTFRLDHLNLSDGLPNSSVSKMVQDSNGFMWLGTLSGLSKYDGYNFTTYLNDPFDNNSLPHNLIQTMYIDKDDILWLGTYNGLSRFDINKNTFDNYPSIGDVENSLSNDVVVAIERDSKGRLWIGTLDGLNLFDEQTGTFTRFYNDPENSGSLPNNTVRSIFNDANDNLWIGTYGGLSQWDENTEGFINYTYDENDPESISSIYVMNIIQNPVNDDVILLGTWGGGITAFNTKTKKSTRYEIPDMIAYTMLADEDNRIWAGTWGGGLVILSLNDGTYDHYVYGTSSDLSHNIVYSLYQDLSGIVWIGTKGGGIDKYVGWKNQYTFFTNDENNPGSLLFGEIRVAYEDSQNRFWFGVIGSGLSRYNDEKNSFTNYSYDENDENSLSNAMINSIFEDSYENLWIGTNNGLNRYLEESDSFERIYAGEEGASLPENLIYTIVEDHDKNLWFGSYTRGISVLDHNSGNYRYYRHDNENPESISDNLVRSMTVDSLGKIWIATNKGLNLYLPETDSFKSYLHDSQNRSSISSNDVRKIFEDSEGNLWIATNGGGVNLFNREKETFSIISTIDGLLNNAVSGIEEDSKGNLLFITQAGISLYNIEEKSFSIIDEKTGLLSSELTSGYLKATDGSFYIGSNKGITHIPYFTEQTSLYTPQIHINRFSVSGIPFENDQQPIWDDEEVVLKYQQNTFSFEFALIDYSSDGKNQFAYKLEGVDTDWVYSGVRNFARYARLNPGEYMFKVIGADSRSNWNNTGTSLKITILPPFWFSAYAFFLYAITAILLIALVVFRIYSKRMETMKKIEEQDALNVELENRVTIRTAQIEEAREVAENATKAKSLFLANMSHELRTPLNAVVGFSALLDESDYSPEKKHIISSIKAAGKSLSTLINDLLDLSKLEAGKMTIKYAPINLTTILFEIKHIFDLKVKEKDLVFHIEVDDQIPRELMLDETRFRQILINLTGNAFKYTDSGFINIKVNQFNAREGFIDLVIVVEDTGTGISDLEKEKIFELFWQSDNDKLNKSTGTGLGLSITKNLVKLMNGEISVTSKQGKGSTFTIHFKDIAVPVSDFIESKSTNTELLENITFKGIKALIVDDIEDNRNLLIEIMKKIRIDYQYALNGSEAISICREYNPDIILMDLQMPVMDGFTAAENIKNDPETGHIPIVAVTASTETDHFNSDGLKVNYFSDYITKPYSLKNIINVLKNLLSFHTYDIDEDEVYNQVSFDNELIKEKELLMEKLNVYKKEWKELKPSGRMSVLENFAMRLKDLGKNHDARGLIAYAEDLLLYIKQFDLSNVEIELARYPYIMEKLNK